MGGVWGAGATLAGRPCAFEVGAGGEGGHLCTGPCSRGHAVKPWGVNLPTLGGARVLQ
jgi:hypothetical protein